MDTLQALKKIRSECLHRMVHTLAEGSGNRQDFRDQVEMFYDRVEQGVATGEAGCLDAVIENWADALPQTDLEDSKAILPHLLCEMMTITFGVGHEMLEAGDAAALIAALAPIYGYGFEKSSSCETQAKVRFISEKLNQTQSALERLERSKSDFIAIAAHELKTPLTLVEGYSAMLTEKLPKNDQAAFYQMLMEGVENGISRLKLIIDDMIDVSLIDNNLMSLNFQPVWLSKLLAALRNELASSIQERRQTLTVNDFPGSDLMIYGDPARLMQVLRNVVTNAVKYTPDGGGITIDGRQLPGFLEVIVSDSGIGIDPDDQQKIFEKFGGIGEVALHSSGKTKFKGGGPGLGLFIARGIAETHGGAIWVDSPGRDEQNCPGATFHILLPIRREAPGKRAARLLASLGQENL